MLTQIFKRIVIRKNCYASTKHNISKAFQSPDYSKRFTLIDRPSTLGSSKLETGISDWVLFHIIIKLLPLAGYACSTRICVQQKRLPWLWDQQHRCFRNLCAKYFKCRLFLGTPLQHEALTFSSEIRQWLNKIRHICTII